MPLPLSSLAPTFEAFDQDGQRRTLDDFCARGPLVLFFYPGDFTPVCTREVCAFRDQLPRFAGNVQVAGISGDTVDKHKRFAEAYQLTYPLLADPGDVIRDRYQVKGTLGVIGRRVTYIIDTQKTIRGIITSDLFAQKHVDEALAAIDRL